jgi:hypothetical protein
MPPSGMALSLAFRGKIIVLPAINYLLFKNIPVSSG